MRIPLMLLYLEQIEYYEARMFMLIWCKIATPNSTTHSYCGNARTAICGVIVQSFTVRYCDYRFLHLIESGYIYGLYGVVASINSMLVLTFRPHGAQIAAISPVLFTL